MSGTITTHGEGCYVNLAPEVRYTRNNKKVASFTAMSSMDKKNAEGKYDRGPTNFTSVEAWGHHADYVEQHFPEGKASIDFVGVEVVEEYISKKDGEKKTIKKVKIWEKGGSLSLHDGQTSHGTAKSNGYAPEPIVKEPEGTDDDADLCPF